MNPYDSEKSEPNFWLSCILVNEEAMCKQVRGEKDALYVPEHGKELSDGDSGKTCRI